MIRDLTRVARADGTVDADELAILHRIADAVGVARSLIAATAPAPVELD